MVQVSRGTVFVPVVNVGVPDVLLYPRVSLGSLSSADIVSLPAGVSEIHSISASLSSQVATDDPGD